MNGGLALFAFSELRAIEAELAGRLRSEQSRRSGLTARLSYDSRRSRLGRGLGAAIRDFRPGVATEDAARFAEMVLDVTEEFEGVDPLLLVSVGIVESGYDPGAVSHAGARGLYQIYPPTGRRLARTLGWEFTEELLHDPVKNTEMAATYLGLLGTTYNDVGMVLAEYNGGPLNAGYFRAEADEIAEETKNYVPKVLDVYRKLDAVLDRDR